MIDNGVILVLHVALIGGVTLLFLRLGKEAMVAWISLLTVLANLFVLKQITLFSLEVTCSDALAVGYLLGLNLIQEFFGRKMARKAVFISLLTALVFLALSQIHLAYTPNFFDMTDRQFRSLLSPMPRLIFASLFSFLVVQILDIAFFAFLREKTSGKYLTLRIALSLVCAQLLDTVLFSFLGLYGLVAHITHVILLSLLIKGIVIVLNTPFFHFSKRFVHYDAV